MRKKILTKSVQETEKLAKEFVQYLSGGKVVALSGDLGSGKTTFTQFVAKTLGVNDIVNSPTFLIAKEYKILGREDIKTLYHLDLYRLKSKNEVIDIGLDQITSDPHGVVFIEWPEIANELLPKNTMHITFTYIDEDTREVEMSDE